MSNIRKDKTCLNCGTTVEDVFCPHCGQKNIETHVNALHALGEFIGDYFHADGKFFASLIPLIFHPGRMTRDYNSGKRTKYIHPFRLYIFISIVFFFIYFSRDNQIHFNNRDLKNTAGLTDSVKTAVDSVIKDTTNHELNLTIENLPATIKVYDDSLSKLSADKRPNFFKEFLSRRIIKEKEMGEERFLEEWQRHFFHNIPTMMFFLLPLVALILKLLYVRRKKYYIEHLIFSVHIHSFVFFLFLIITLLNIAGVHGLNLNFAAFWIIMLYVFIALRNVYHQGYFKTLFKLGSFLFLYLIAFIIIIVFNLIYTTANI